ncbi:MAG: O-antigen ligase family protein [Phycisphaerales bacterium]|nr:O-antigen ligase family protein [Phycisphaerales bacterium]
MLSALCSLALAPLLLRAITAQSLIPGWDADPAIEYAPVVGITPALSLALDALSIFASGLMLILAKPLNAPARSRLRAAVAPSLSVYAWLCALLAIAYHATLSNSADLQQARVGASWASAFTLALALFFTAHHRAVRTALISAFVGVCSLMVFKGAVQVFVDHPALVRSFEANKEAFLAAQGWTSDSSSAKSYIRRLSQPEASAWFGLSNVFATISVILTALSLGQFLAAVDRRRDKLASERTSSDLTFVALFALTTLLGILGVALAGGKGGFASLFFALCLFLLPRLLRSKPALNRFTPVIIPATIALVLALIALRGYLGERFSELSLLFRAFYIEASARIFASHPLLGVGPDGYKDLYTIFKNPLSPEEVASPHSILFDWICCLGLPGVVLCIAWLLWLSRAGRALGAAHSTSSTTNVETPTPNALRIEVRLAMLTASAVVLAAMALESQALVPVNAAVMVGGLLVWCVVALACVQTSTFSTPLARGVCIAAAACAVHSQIEVTASWHQSAVFVLALSGAAGVIGAALTRSPESNPANVPTPEPSAHPASPRTLPAISGLIALTAAAALALGIALPAWKLHAATIAAADVLRPFAELRTARAAASDPSMPAEARQLLFERARNSFALAMEVNPPQSIAELEQRAFAFQPFATADARDRLLLATRDLPRTLQDWRLDREIKRLIVQTTRDDGTTKSREACRQALFTPPPHPGTRGSAPKLAWNLSVTANWLATGQTNLTTPEEVVDFNRKALAADPSNVQHALNLTRLLVRFRTQLDPTGQLAKQAAQETLRRSDLMRLDPDIRALTPKERAEVESISK